MGLPIDSGLTLAHAPNDVWSTDFKGEFRLGNGELCYPLTAQDLLSRYLIGTTALSSTAAVPVQIAFTRHFEQFGLPLVIRSDNGVPFASPSAIGRLSKLSVWWIRLGIRPERIEPGEPQQDGKHERMHKTLKAESTRPPGSNFRSRRFQLSTTLTNQETGLEETEEDLWTVSFGPLTLGTLHYPSNTFMDEVRWKSNDSQPEAGINAEGTTRTATEGLPILRSKAYPSSRPYTQSEILN